MFLMPFNLYYVLFNTWLLFSCYQRLTTIDCTIALPRRTSGLYHGGYGMVRDVIDINQSIIYNDVIYLHFQCKSPGILSLLPSNRYSLIYCQSLIPGFSHFSWHPCQAWLRRTFFFSEKKNTCIRIILIRITNGI